MRSRLRRPIPFEAPTWQNAPRPVWLGSVWGEECVPAIRHHAQAGRKSEQRHELPASRTTTMLPGSRSCRNLC